jgi:hypothetical protein
VKFNSKPLSLIFFQRALPDAFAGMTYGPVVLIAPGYEDDVGLLEHEFTHVRQFWRTCGLHLLFYPLWRAYRLRSEIEAYKVQMGYGLKIERAVTLLMRPAYDFRMTAEVAAGLLMASTEESAR